jgi:NhaC family Na+:H+ antiporter
MAVTLGVATHSYLPYAVFNFASPLLAIAMAYTGIRMLRPSPKDEVVATASQQPMTKSR